VETSGEGSALACVEASFVKIVVTLLGIRGSWQVVCVLYSWLGHFSIEPWEKGVDPRSSFGWIEAQMQNPGMTTSRIRVEEAKLYI